MKSGYLKFDGDNLQEIIHTAKARARKTNRTWFVVVEDEHNGRYHAADDLDLDTWYAGNNHIVYCSAE